MTNPSPIQPHLKQPQMQQPRFRTKATQLTTTTTIQVICPLINTSTIPRQHWPHPHLILPQVASFPATLTMEANITNIRWPLTTLSLNIWPIGILMAWPLSEAFRDTTRPRWPQENILIMFRLLYLLHLVLDIRLFKACTFCLRLQVLTRKIDDLHAKYMILVLKNHHFLLPAQQYNCIIVVIKQCDDIIAMLFRILFFIKTLRKMMPNKKNKFKSQNTLPIHFFCWVYV